MHIYSELKKLLKAYDFFLKVKPDVAFSPEPFPWVVGAENAWFIPSRVGL